jgi:hypothetical protein
MSDIVKVCKHHGPLAEELVIRERIKDSDKFLLRCRYCRRFKDQLYKSKNRAVLARNQREYYADNREKVIEAQKIYSKLHPEVNRKARAKYRSKMGPLRTELEILRRRQITLERYHAMLVEQDDRCAICNRKENRKSRNGGITRLCIDHCHETNAVRGLLCHSCNTAIGKLEDNLELILKAHDYVKYHKERITHVPEHETQSPGHAEHPA